MSDTTQQLGAYQFLSKLFINGLTEELYTVASTIPSLAPHLPAAYDADQAAVEHQDLFGFNVLPHAGVFLSSDGKLGGDIDFQCNRFYEAFSFEAYPETPDHIGTQLAFLAYLIELETNAPKNSKALKQAQSDFLQHHVMPWINTFLFALKGQGNPLYAEIADLTQALTLHHFSRVVQDKDSDISLPELPDILNDPKTGMKQIALFLLRPAYSGIYLSKQEIKAISRSLTIPTGFGDRGQLLSNVFQAALNFDTFPLVLEQLTARTHAFKRHYESLGTPDTPAITNMMKPWIARTENTLKITDVLTSKDIAQK